MLRERGFIVDQPQEFHTRNRPRLIALAWFLHIVPQSLGLAVEAPHAWQAWELWGNHCLSGSKRAASKKKGLVTRQASNAPVPVRFGGLDRQAFSALEAERSHLPLISRPCLF